MSEEPPKRKRDNSSLWYATGIAVLVVLFFWMKSGFSPGALMVMLPIGALGIGLGWLQAYRVRRNARKRLHPLDMR